MGDFMKKRLLNQTRYGSICAFICGGYALINLLLLAFDVFVYKQFNIVTVLSTGINIVFYIIICRNFTQSKVMFYYAFSAILCMLICEYVISFVIDVIFNIAILASPVVILMIATYGIPISYFIIMYLEARKRTKGLRIALFILGILIGILGLVRCVFLTINNISTIVDFFGGVKINLDNIMTLIYFILSVISSLFVCAFSFIYFGYPIILKQVRDYD